jgi:hypothetical protein
MTLVALRVSLPAQGGGTNPLPFSLTNGLVGADEKDRSSALRYIRHPRSCPRGESVRIRSQEPRWRKRNRWSRPPSSRRFGSEVMLVAPPRAQLALVSLLLGVRASRGSEPDRYVSDLPAAHEGINANSDLLKDEFPICVTGS